MSIHAPADAARMLDLGKDQVVIPPVGESPTLEPGDTQPSRPEKVLIENPHEVRKGQLYDQDTLDWWETQRTNIFLSQEKIGEMVGDL